MADIQLWFAGLWPIISHYTFWVVSMAACGAVIWLRPALWKPVIWTAVVITAGTICYAVGVYDGKKHERARCNFEKKLAVEGAKQARVKARADLARKQSRGLPDDTAKDPACRDC